jgi:hypothetical protein
MSTRGCIGTVINAKGNWRGVYNHSDSYPTWLGKDLWSYLHEASVNVDAFCKEILTYNDWREFRNGGMCEYCGKVGVGQPHSIGGGIYLDRANGQLFPDPDAKLHSHRKEPATIYSENAKYEALFIEWVYIVNPNNRTISIYANGRAKGSHRESALNGNTWMEPNYQWVPVDTINIDEAEPDWQSIEDSGRAISDQLYEKWG